MSLNQVSTVESSTSPDCAGMNVGRQTHLVAGIFVWAGLLLGLNASPWWFVLVGLPGFGLLLDALTGICPMTLILKKMSWNRA